jgi:hypothetical protein
LPGSISQLALVDVLRSLRAVATKTAAGPLSEREFTRLRDHIDENVSERLTLVDLAAFLDMPW